MKMEKIELTLEDKINLKNLHKSTKDGRNRDKIKAIILFANGYSKNEIKRILLIDKKTINYYIKKYIKSGIEGLLKSNYIAYKGKLTAEEIEILRNELRNKIYLTAKEVCEYVKKRFNKKYRPESMVKLLNRIGFSYKKTKQVPSKANREKQEKFVEKYDELKHSIGENEKIYFLDAVHPKHNSMPAYGWIEKGKEKEILSNTGRDRVNINGLYSPVDHEIVIRQDESINGQSTVSLLQRLENMHPELDVIYIIRDNAKYYGSEPVKEYLKTSRIKMMPLPSYSPNLNLIERLWKFMKKKILYNEYYASYLEFKNAIDDFFDNKILQKKYKDELTTLMTENFHIFETI
jgi:transposase